MLNVHHNLLLLFLATSFHHDVVGFSFVSVSLRNHFSRHWSCGFPRRVRLCMSSIDVYDSDTNDYEESSNYDSSISSDWESSDYNTEKEDAAVTFEQVDNFDINERSQLTEEDIWLEDIIDEIHNEYATLEDGPLYDTSIDEPTGRSVEDSVLGNMDKEITMLVRCNERPDTLLIEEGRALPPLTEDERNDVSQLVLWNEESNEFEATEFFRQAVSKIFRKHAKPSVFDGVLSMDRAGVAAWMTKALSKEEKGKVSQHDKRVLKTLSDFGEYGSGRLVEENFQNLYLSCVTGDTSNIDSVERHLKWRTEFRDAVWRDIRAHGILSPVEEERLHLVEKLNARDSELTQHGYVSSTGDAEEVFMDECEILDWEYSAPELKQSKNDVEKYVRESSYKLVEMADDKKTPLRIRDGNFVFIDEDSCIGCRQCVNIAPDSFLMMESGRARTFVQRTGLDVVDAVSACPVSCMHRVSFQELRTCETARDKSDGKTGDYSPPHHGGHIPLHVARRDSDRNRRTSLYHSLKAKCAMNSGCPKNGCYDCPSYRHPGENPYFIAKHKKAEHARAQHFIRNGEADVFRKSVDL